MKFHETLPCLSLAALLFVGCSGSGSSGSSGESDESEELTDAGIESLDEATSDALLEAIDLFEEALDADPDNDVARSLLAMSEVLAFLDEPNTSSFLGSECGMDLETLLDRLEIDLGEGTTIFTIIDGTAPEPTVPDGPPSDPPTGTELQSFIRCELIPLLQETAEDLEDISPGFTHEFEEGLLGSEPFTVDHGDAHLIAGALRGAEMMLHKLCIFELAFDIQGLLELEEERLTGGDLVEIQQVGDTFVPQEVDVAIGETVRWTWTSGSHTVTEGDDGTLDGDEAFHSFLDATTTSFEVLFDEALVNGAPTIEYFCLPHFFGGMTGTISITDSDLPTQLFTGDSPSFVVEEQLCDGSAGVFNSYSFLGTQDLLDSSADAQTHLDEWRAAAAQLLMNINDAVDGKVVLEDAGAEPGLIEIDSTFICAQEVWLPWLVDMVDALQGTDPSVAAVDVPDICGIEIHLPELNVPEEIFEAATFSNRPFLPTYAEGECYDADSTSFSHLSDPVYDNLHALAAQFAEDGSLDGEDMFYVWSSMECAFESMIDDEAGCGLED